MRVLAGVMAAAVLAGVVSGVGAADALSTMKLCTAYSEMAEEAAKARYNGVPIRKLMAEIEDTGGEKKVHRAVVEGAYKLPDYSSDEHQQHEITEYGSKIYMICLERFQEGD